MRLWLALLLVAPTLAQAQPVQLSKLEAFLVYSKTGKLSFDLLAPRQEPHELFNTVIGEGASGGAANDVLLIAHFSTKAEPINQQSDVVSLKVMSEEGVVLYQAKELALSFIGEEHAAKAILLEGVTCGNVFIEVNASGKVTKSELPFFCGE